MKPHENRLRLGILIGVALLLAFSLVQPLIEREPVYWGEPLSYWLNHWYEEQHESANARQAVVEAGTNAIPYLLKYLGQRAASPHEPDRASQAIQAFRVLGPTASPAIPRLIAMLGKPRNRAASALASIGPAAIPALTNFIHEGADRRAREQAIMALCYMGTNAEPALPTLIYCLDDTEALIRWHALEGMVQAGKYQPQIVIPELLVILTNLNSSPKAAAAVALGNFESAAVSAVPALSAASQDRDPQVRTAAAAALVRISPGLPGAFDPLIRNLSHPVVGVRQHALWALQHLGTNAAPALPSLAHLCSSDPDPQLRIQAMECIGHIKQGPDWVISAINGNVLSSDVNVSKRAIYTLARFADASLPAFAGLLQAWHDQPGLREPIVRGLKDGARTNPTFLLQCLQHEDTVIRYHAVRLLQIAAISLPDSVPLLVKLVHDDDEAVRRAAAEELLARDPVLAREMGIPRLP